MLKINHLAVRPAPVEGRMANYDTVSFAKEGGQRERFVMEGGIERIYGNGNEVKLQGGQMLTLVTLSFIPFHKSFHSLFHAYSGLIPQHPPRFADVGIGDGNIAWLEIHYFRLCFFPKF